LEKPKKTVAVIMQRRAIQSRWQDVAWEPFSVLESDEPAGAARVLVDGEGIAQWLHPGFEVFLHRDEAQGYYMNVSSDTPRVFVMWRMEGDDGLPVQVTVSYDEAGRWLDGGHSVDPVPMSMEIFAWVGEYVEKNYRPEPPRKKIKPRSFLHPKDRPA
jgi:hypothetical protein